MFDCVKISNTTFRCSGNLNLLTWNGAVLIDDATGETGTFASDKQINWVGLLYGISTWEKQGKRNNIDHG